MIISKEQYDKLPERLQKWFRYGNFHCTTKPIKLMAYLIELGCHPDGVVLDPFLGSGTTCLAAQQLNRKWIGIELSPEYIKIAAARLGVEDVVQIKNTKSEVVEKVDVKEIKVKKKGSCSYEGKCSYRSSKGMCKSKRYCKDKGK